MHSSPAHRACRRAVASVTVPLTEKRHARSAFTFGDLFRRSDRKP